MKVLVVTNMYPVPEEPAFGIFVHEQVIALRQQGVEVDVFFINGHRHRRNYLTGGLRFLPIPWRTHYDLIHAHYPLTGVIARCQWRSPLILTYHGIEVVYNWQRIVSLVMARLVDRVIVTSSRVARDLPGVQIDIIPYGVDFDLFRPHPQEESRARLGLPMDAHLVLFCGMDRPEKRLDLARAAVARLADQDPPVQLVIASGKAHEEIPHYMNACDVLVLTSDYEGSPMVIKEAMACNLPIVSVDVGDVRQVIGETKGCYLAERSVDDIAAKLRLALAYGQRTDGRSRIAHLDNRLIAQRLIGLYEDVLRRKKT